MRLPDFSELLLSQTSPVHGGPTVTLAKENKDLEIEVVIFFTQARGVMFLMECLCPIQSYSDKKKILSLVRVNISLAASDLSTVTFCI